MNGLDPTSEGEGQLDGRQYLTWTNTNDDNDAGGLPRELHSPRFHFSKRGAPKELLVLQERLCGEVPDTTAILSGRNRVNPSRLIHFPKTAWFQFYIFLVHGKFGTHLQQDTQGDRGFVLIPVIVNISLMILYTAFLTLVHCVPVPMDPLHYSTNPSARLQ